jgi:hypothetical protein
MKIHSRRLSFATCLAGLVFAGAASAAVIKSQPTCAGASGFCLQFSAPGTTIPVIRSIAFIAPSAGTAAVSFHGSLVCSNNSTTDKVLDFATQIVTSASAVPVVNGAGALRLATVLKDSTEHTLNTTDTLNLASTRVFSIPGAGQKNYYFKIAALRMDASTTCLVYSATFTVQFVP